MGLRWVNRANGSLTTVQMGNSTGGGFSLSNYSATDYTAVVRGTSLNRFRYSHDHSATTDATVVRYGIYHQPSTVNTVVVFRIVSL